MIYLLENRMPYGRVVAFKVGFTEGSIDKRMVQYKTHNPYVEWLATSDGDKEIEKAWHDRMKNSDIFYQVRSTEWFEVTDKNVIKGIEKNGFRYLEALFNTRVESEEE